MRGSEFVGRFSALSPAAREAKALELARAGSFVRWPMLPVKVLFNGFAGEFYVASDYFSLGTEDDFLRMPLSPLAAQKIADVNGWTLPTKKMVDSIWHDAQLRLPPQPWGPPFDASMLSMQRFDDYDRRITMLLDRNYPEGWKGRLIAGHKKDVVLSNKLRPGHVAIYGWHQPNGAPIQGLNVTSHDDHYADYSHGIRFVEATMLVNGQKMKIADVFASPEMCSLVSDEGVLLVTRQPTLSPPPSEGSMDLKVGSKGNDVADWQSFLNEHGFRDADGLKLIADGDFGKKSEFATQQFQKANGIIASGVVDSSTRIKAASIMQQSEPTIPGVTIPTYDFIQAKNYTSASRDKIDLVVIHDMEYPERPGGAEWCANFFAGPNAPQASAHYAVDSVTVIQCVKEKDVAWHAPGANRSGIGIEHVGFAAQSRADWMDPYSLAELRTSAKLTAEICRRWGIPVVKLSVDELKTGARGLCGHIDVTNAFNGGKGHTDPGPGFPWDYYVELVKAG